MIVSHRSQRIETLSRNRDLRSIGMRCTAMDGGASNRRHSRCSSLMVHAVRCIGGIALTWIKLPC